MATITQRLAFLISANAEGAIKAFDKTANAAEKELGKAQKSIDRLGVNMTKFGAVGLAAAGTLGTGLFKLAQGAIEDQKAQELLAQQLRSSTGATEAQIAAVEKSIDTMARATGVADDQLRPAFGNLVRATGDITKAQQVFQTAMDISAATGRDLQTVTIALGRAANGQIGSLSRLGIPLDENVKKSKDFDAALQALNQQFGGAAATAADTYAGKMARAQVAISEAGESLGSAFIPFVEQAANAITKGVGVFDSLQRATGGAIGKFVAFGTVGLGVVSGLSLIGGQAIKLRTRFTELGEDGVRSLNNIGRAAKVASVGLGAIAATEAVFAVLNEVTDSAGKTSTALQELTVALAGADNAAKLEGFRTLVKRSDETLKFSSLWTDFGKEIKIVGGDISRDIEEIDSAFKMMLKDSGPAAAKALLDAWAMEAAMLDTNGQQYKDNMMLIERYRKQIGLLNDAQAASNELNKVPPETVNMQMRLAFARERQSDMWAKYFDRVKQSSGATDADTAKTERNAEATKKATEAKQKFAQKVADAAEALRTQLSTALDEAKEKLKQTVDDFNAYQQGVNRSIMSTINFGNAQQMAAGNSQALTDAVKAQTEAQSKYSSALSKQAQAQADYDEAVSARNAAEAKFTETLRQQGWAIRDSVDYNAAVVAAQQRLVASTEEASEAQAELGARTDEVTSLSKQPSTFLSVLQDQATQATTFAGNITKLLDLGADQATIDRLVESGAEVGNQIAQEILSSSNPEQYVDEIDRLIASTQKVADQIGLGAANKFKKAGVDNALAYADGVQAVFDNWYPMLSEENIAGLVNPLKTLSDWAETIRKQLSDLGTVQVPPTPQPDPVVVPIVYEETTDFYAIAGIALGQASTTEALKGKRKKKIPKLAEGGIVQSEPGGRLVLLGEGGRDEAVIPLPAPGQLPSQTQTVNVTINVNGGDPNAVVEALKRYVRSNGALPNSIKVSA